MAEYFQQYDQNLWQLYQQTQFRVGAGFSLPDKGAIVTACNPKGKVLSLHQNQQRSLALCQQLDDSDIDYQSLTGISPDACHQEASVLVACDNAFAIELCEQWQQNAYYWLEQGQLWLRPALHPGPEVAMGPLSKRLITG